MQFVRWVFGSIGFFESFRWLTHTIRCQGADEDGARMTIKPNVSKQLRDKPTSIAVLNQSFTI